MSTTSDKFGKSVLRVITKTGWDMYITVLTATGGYVVPGNPSSGNAYTAVDNLVKGNIVPWDQKYMPGTSIEQGESIAIIATLDSADMWDPFKMTSKLKDGTNVYQIAAVELVKVSGVVVGAFLQIGK